MKLSHLILPVILFAALFFSACELEDPGVEVDPRDKFLGVWSVAEECNRLSYDINITYDLGNSAQVLIANFANPGPGYDPVVGLVAGNKIIVQQQTAGPNWTVSGDGTYDASRDIVRWNYSITLGGDLLTCTADYTR